MDTVGAARFTNRVLFRGVDRIAMLRCGESFRSDVRRVRAKGALDRFVQIRIPADEARAHVADEVAENVVRDDELAVDMGAGADAVDENVEPLTDVGCRRGGN